jgi:lipoyl(octanoyl) transferase
MINIKFIDLGLKDYKETWDYQEVLLEELQLIKRAGSENNFGGYLLFVEHPHVFTLGKSGQKSNLLISETLMQQLGASFYHINRGGDITYHGPGQMVVYPIINLETFNLGIREYIEKLEDVVINSLSQWKVKAGRQYGATGIWLDVQTPAARKICAIGVRVSRFITMHGFAFNINTNLNYYSYINPCGFQDKGVTSLSKELNRTIDFHGAEQIVKEKFSEVFKMNLI